MQSLFVAQAYTESARAAAVDSLHPRGLKCAHAYWLSPHTVIKLNSGRPQGARNVRQVHAIPQGREERASSESGSLAGPRLRPTTTLLEGRRGRGGERIRRDGDAVHCAPNSRAGGGCARCKIRIL